jgi:hypothetical protein|tara:strand:+ start:43 stop:315 length:273 start_codon:yes stop_codon:yes gene_type:complete
MNLYQKVENIIRDHIIEHQREVFDAKALLAKLDISPPNNNPPEDYSYNLTETGEKKSTGLERKSIYWYDFDRNDPNRPNPFAPIPDYTEL